MSGVATAVAGSAVLGYMGSQEAGRAATDANNANLGYQRENNAANRAAELERFQLTNPFQASGGGKEYVSKLHELMSGNVSDIYSDPIFQGQLTMGQDAISRRFAADGNAGSGAERIGLMQYTTGAAQDAYTQKYNRLKELSGATSQAPGAYAGGLSTLAGIYSKRDSFTKAS